MSDWVPFEFGRPWLLILGPIAIAMTIVMARRSLAGQSLVAKRISTAVRILLIVVLTLSLADLRFTRRSDRLTVLFLADASASVPKSAREEILESYADRSQGLRHGDQVGLIVFGRDAAVERQPSRDLGSPAGITHIQSVIDGEATDIAAALRLADATFSGFVAFGEEGAEIREREGGRRVVLISDGNANRGDDLLEARHLAASGAVVDVLPLRYAYREETMIDSIQVPPEVHPEEPFLVEAILHSEVPTRGRVQLYENDRLLETRELDLPAGKTRVEFPLVRNEKSRYRYEVRLLVDQSEDVLLKNNVGHAFTLVRGEARVLLVGDPDELDPLLAVLNSAQIFVETVSPEAVPLDPESYFLYDAIVVADVPAFQLGVDRMRLLNGVVKNLGVGFVMIGGPDSFGAGGYRGTAIEKLLPVEMEVKQREILPNGALAMILHTCEFAAGNMWAKQIAGNAVEALTAEDYVGVLSWGNLGRDEWGVPLGPCTDKSGIIARINQLQPRDMPAFTPSMQMAFQALSTAPATSKHIVIISDGDPVPPSASVMRSLISAKITATAVCINPHGGTRGGGGTATMKKIARDTGGRYYLVTDPRDLPGIFFREALQIRRNLITEETFTPGIQLVTDAIRGLEEAGFPPLHGYVITTPKPLAEVALTSHHDDPILSSWRYGLGRTAAFTSDATSRWAGDWISWPGFETLWAQLIRSVSKRGSGEIFRVERSIEGDRGRILLDAIDPEGRYLDGLEISGRILDPQFDEQEVTYRQTGPGRYEAHFSARRSGTYLLSVNYDDGAGFRGSYQTGINVSYSPEYRELSNDEAHLAELAAATGGRVLSLADDPFSRDFPVRLVRMPLWESILELALVLFFVDIFHRRVRVRLAPLRRLLAWLPRPSRREVEPARPRSVTALLRRREEVRRGHARRAETIEASRRSPEALEELGESAPTEVAPQRREPEKPEPTFTDRLLRAKREARKRQESGPGGEDGG